MKPRVGGFAGTRGSGGTYDDPTGYISPLHQEVIDSNIEHTYTYQLILGTLTEIRVHVYAQQYRSGLITQLRFDPAFNGESGDYVDVKAISSNPFAGNEHIAPTLNIARTNGDIVVTFPTITAATAGFIGKNLRYDLESTTALTPVNWQPVAGVTNVLGDGSPKTFINPPSSDPAKFFRLKVRLE